MLHVRRGDRGPMVAAIQDLINRYERACTLIVDGVFGAITESAVRRVSSSPGQSASGIVDGQVWSTLSAGEDVAILSANDIYDPAHDDDRYVPPDLRGPGLIRTGGMCGGVGQIVAEVVQRASTQGQIILLRFYGHGRGGLMAVSAGNGRMRDINGQEIPGAPRPDHEAHQSVISTANFRAIEGHLSRLRPLFAPLGSIEFHGCHVGAGAEGARLLRMTAEATGVPATAAIESQYFGPSTAYRFEGPTRTMFPGGRSLRQWARAKAAEAARV